MQQRIDKCQLFNVWLFTCEGDPLLPSGGHLIEIQVNASDSFTAGLRLKHPQRVHIPRMLLYIYTHCSKNSQQLHLGKNIAKKKHTLWSFLIVKFVHIIYVSLL